MPLSPSALTGEGPVAPAFPHHPPAAAAVAHLEARGCRWPVGEPGDAGFTFCGGPRLARGSYCAFHAGLARTGARSCGGRP